MNEVEAVEAAAEREFEKYEVELAAHRDEIARLRRGVAFFASVIKCGESWSEHCQRVLDGGEP